MSRPTDWDVLDLDRDPTPGDPARLRQLASRFHDFADTAYRARLAVESLQGDGSLLTWVGLSGDAFRNRFGEFPTQVQKLYQSHLMAGDALEEFAPVLQTAQAQADRALADGRAAAEKLRTLQGALDVATADFTGASQAAAKAQAETAAPDPDQIEQAVRDADAAKQAQSAAQARVDGAQQELTLAKQLAQQAKDLRDGGARTAQREIDAASDAGIQPRSFWQKLGDAFKELWNIICEVAQWVALVAGIIGMIIGGPLAWIALFAGAILLVKAIVDFAQGKGSVMDLVFGLLGVIPGVKGLTSLSRLSQLYKAGGLKAIAKATLTGMKTMAKDMVGLVKAAGQGALTIIKKLGDSSASVIGAVKNAGVVLTDAVKGGAKITPPDPGRGLGKGVGFGAPDILPPLPKAGLFTNFRQQFADLAALRNTTKATAPGKIKADFATRLTDGKNAINTTFDGRLQTRTGEIKTDFANKLTTQKGPIETRFADELTVRTDKVKTDYQAKFDAEKADIVKQYDEAKTNLDTTFRNQVDLKVNELGTKLQTDLAEVPARRARIDLYDQRANAQITEFNRQIDIVQNGGGNPADIIKQRDDLINGYGEQRAAEINRIDNLQNQYNADLGALNKEAKDLYDVELGKLDKIRDDAINAADTRFSDLAKGEIGTITDEVNAAKDLEIKALETRLDGELNAELAKATGTLDTLRNTELGQLETRLNGELNTELGGLDLKIDNHFAALDSQLHGKLLDEAGTNWTLKDGSTVKVIEQGVFGPRADDVALVAERNWPDIGQINPNKDLRTDVNCTLCVQSFNKMVKTGEIDAVPKVADPRILERIEANFTGLADFDKKTDYTEIIDIMAKQPKDTVGVIGFHWQESGVDAAGKAITVDKGHVLNVITLDTGKVGIVDGQSGTMGSLLKLDFTKPENGVYFMQFPDKLPLTAPVNPYV